MIEFLGWIIDPFKTEAGSLGLTIEKQKGLPDGDENPFVDVFVGTDLKVHSTNDGSPSIPFDRLLVFLESWEKHFTGGSHSSMPAHEAIRLMKDQAQMVKDGIKDGRLHDNTCHLVPPR